MAYIDVNIDWLNYVLIPSLEKVYQNDYSLIKRNAHERSIAGHLYYYMRCIMESLTEEMKGLNIELEYNRNGLEPKRVYQKCTYCCKEKDCYGINMESENKSVFPDIIIHKREKNKKNQVVIEVKKDTNSESRIEDYKKLKYFTCHKDNGNTAGEDYKYLVGYFIDFSEKCVVVKTFEDAKKVDCKKFIYDFENKILQLC